MAIEQNNERYQQMLLNKLIDIKTITMGQKQPKKGRDILLPLGKNIYDDFINFLK